MPSNPTSLQNLLERTLPRIRRSQLTAIGAALVVFLIALGARFGLSGALPAGLPFLTFFVAVPIATLVGGAAGGFMVVALSAGATWYWFRPHDPDDAPVAIAVFAFLSSLLIWLVHLLNRTVERLLHERRRGEGYLHNAALAEQRLVQLNDELRHRNKNAYAVIGTIIAQSARYARTVEALVESLRGRLLAMSVSQDIVLSSDTRTANLRKLATDVLAPLKPPGNERLEISGTDIEVVNDLATPLGLVLHELATNCLKYGAWSNNRGRVSLEWTTHRSPDADEQLVVEWKERGGPKTVAPNDNGMGTILIERGVPGAKVTRTFGADGLACLIEVALPEILPTTTSMRRG